MNPEHQVNAGNGVYEPSDRAAGAAKKATAENHAPFYGEGMHEGNTTPQDNGKSSTKPAKGASVPNPKDTDGTQPGAGANKNFYEKGTV